MKLRSNFEGIRTNLMNRAIVPSLDECLNELLREEQRLLTQTTMDQQKSASLLVAYAAQGRPGERDMSNVQCFCCKGLDILLPIVQKRLQLLQTRRPHY